MTQTGSPQCRLTLIILLELFLSQALALVIAPFNTTHYFGPDGPWQAVAINISYPDEDAQPINLYPALLWGGAAIYAPNTMACQSVTDGDCGQGGTIPILPSNRSEPQEYTMPRYDPTPGGYSLSYSGDTTYMTIYLENGIYFTQATVAVCDNALYTYENGVQIPTAVGLVGLGGNNINPHTDAAQAFVRSLYAQSDAYSLHIGAAGFDYPGSLIFGGYDKGRVIGPVISYNPYTQLRLLDIVVDVEVGESPFDFGRKDGLLSTEAEALSTFALPQVPYMFLPSTVVRAIVDLLPVTEAPSTGYYLWDTSDSRYARIVSSAAYLGFVFPRTDGPVGNVTIKVPFALLNMTLDGSVTGLPEAAPYLPIVGTDADYFPFTQDSTSCLGRAFLQAAFTGTSWEQNVSWLAQAPGPGVSSQGLGFNPVDLIGTATSLDVQTDQDDFRQSWEGHWTPLPVESSKTGEGETPDAEKTGKSLSGGAIAGIVVGVIAGSVLLAGMAFLAFKRKNQKKQKPAQAAATPMKKTSQDLGELESPAPRYEAAGPDRGELGGSVPSEIYTTKQDLHELPVKETKLK